MSILFCYISQPIGQKKFHIFISKMWRKIVKAVHLRLLFTYNNENLFSIKKQLALVLVHVLFCVFQTNLNKAVNIFCTPSEWIRNIQMIQCFSTIKNLAWLTQKSEELKRNSGFPLCNYSLIALSSQAMFKS